MVFIEPIDDTTCFARANDVTGTVEMGLFAFVLSLTLVTFKHPKHNLMLPTSR